ncbi:MAG: hypothetical protein ABUL60_08880 [Myxococcales bacterium]
MAAKSFARVLLGSVVLGAPFALSAYAASSLVEPFTQRAVALLMMGTAPLAASLPAPAELGTEEPSDAPSTSSELVFDAATKSTAHHGPKPAPKAKPAALFVSAATVLKLAQSNARPRGSFVGATAQHPAGLRLTGVAALGIGVQDGDILTEALGITPHGPGEIIGAIIEARAKQARFLSGTLWRQGQSFNLTVEQPYVPARSPS